MPDGVALEGAAGLVVALDADGRVRVGQGEPDWFGPASLRLDGGLLDGEQPRAGEVAVDEGADDLGRFTRATVIRDAASPVRTTVRAYRDRPLAVFRLEARAALDGIATGQFDRPVAAWPAFRPDQRTPDGLPEGSGAFGHQFSEFGIPTVSDATLSGFFTIDYRPAVVEPLFLVAPDGRSLMLAPLDAFHDQVVAVPRDRDQAELGVRCGWHGDLDEVPAGFATELAVWAAAGPRAALGAHGALLRARHGTVSPSRYSDPSVSHLSYWTDNGASYWYRTDAAHRGDVVATLTHAAESLRDQGIPFRAFQLDSWFYPHRTLRPFDADDDYQVPPAPLTIWDARQDVLPDGVGDLRERLGDPPLITHCRHLSSESPYLEAYACWVDGERAHPETIDLYERWLDQAARWGVVVFEHDWLVEVFLGVRGLREAPARARRWQEELDGAAERRGLFLQWCMGTPADFFQTVTLERVSSIRTSGDYRYGLGNAPMLAWFCYSNALARSLGLHPYKDVFLSNPHGDGLDGDPHAELEALFAALSTGPVGIGDRIGRTDREVVLRTCRADGLLVKPDVPVAALDRCYPQQVMLHPAPLVAAAHSAHAAGRWAYVAAVNAVLEPQELDVRVALDDLPEDRPAGEVVAYDWRAGTLTRLPADGGWDTHLPPSGWDYRVVAPVLPGEITVVGDPTVYATAGDRRLGQVRTRDGGLSLDVLGAPGEPVPLLGWAARPPAAARTWQPGGGSSLELDHDAATGAWRTRVAIPDTGWVRVEVDAG